MDFLPYNEKIRNLRKKLNMNQKDFEDETMTRSYFGMIENGRRNINPELAAKIIKRFKEKADELGISLDIDESYLLITPAEEAEKYCLELLENSQSGEKLELALDISRKYMLKEIEALVFKMKANLEFEVKNYSQAFIYYSSSLDLYINAGVKDVQSYLNNRLGMCKYEQFQYTEALLYFDRAYHYSLIYKDVFTERNSLYNIGICCRKLNKFEKVPKYINKYIEKINKIDDIEDYVHAKSVIANCYIDEGKLDLAEEINNELKDLVPCDKEPLLGFIYTNLGTIYLRKDKLDKALGYFNKSQLIRSRSDKENLSHTLVEKAQLYIKQKLYYEAILIIELAIDTANQYKDIEYVIKGNEALELVYNLLGDYDKIEEILLKNIELIESTKNNFKLLAHYNKLQKLYLNKRDFLRLEECINAEQKIIGSCYNYNM